MGQIAVSSGKVTQFGEIFLEAGQEAGYKVIDYNRDGKEDVSYVQLNTRKGVRSSSSIELLRRAALRDSLDNAINTYATKIEIENKRATGVFVLRRLRKLFIKARTEIILSAGTIASPQLLMLSGVGPKAHLEAMGISPKSDLPVGMNLQNHIQIPHFMKINSSYSITRDIAESFMSMAKYYLFGTGPWASTTVEGSGFFFTTDAVKGRTYHDIQMMFWNSLPQRNAYFNFKVADFLHN